MGPSRGQRRNFRKALDRWQQWNNAAERRVAALEAGRPASVPPDHPTARIAVNPTPEQIALVDAAITTRRSLRAFLPTPVSRETIEDILAVSSRAPSGTNTQPWRVYVLTGEAKAELSRKIVAAYDDPAERATHGEEYAYYPTEWKSPFIDRRRKVGWDLYGLLDIAKTDKARMHAQHGRNYDFFGAPVGLMFTIDRILRQGSWLDYGMFLQSIMIAARGRGLDTCPQAAFMQFHRIISAHVGAPDNEQVVCGMSLGYADPGAIENSLVTEREPVSAFARFLD
jgi:nitroreductase